MQDEKFVTIKIKQGSVSDKKGGHVLLYDEKGDCYHVVSIKEIFASYENRIAKFEERMEKSIRENEEFKLEISRKHSDLVSVVRNLGDKLIELVEKSKETEK